MTDDNDEFLDDQPIEPLFDNNGAMKDEHLAKTSEILKMLAAKMEENPNSMPTDYMNGLAKIMIGPLTPHWGKAPEGSECSICHSKNVERSFVMIGGPYSGSYRCLDCGDVRSVMSHIARTCIKVEPLPQGAALTYEREPKEDPK